MECSMFEIVFDRSWDTIYYSGDTVSGRVLASVNQVLTNLRGLTITMKGQATVYWTETTTSTDSDGKSHSHSHTYSAAETYCEEKRIALIETKGGEPMLDVGEYSFPFNFTLPHNIPSSFHASTGSVKYTIHALMNIPKKKNKEALAIFTVMSSLDLNQEPMAVTGIQLSEEKYFSCCCCRNGPLTLVVSLPVRGFVPGQQAAVTVEVDNCSRLEVQKVTCRLMQNQTFHASGSTNRFSAIVSETIVGCVPAHSSNTWTTLLSIPQIPPSGLPHCKIIDVDYQLQVQGHVASFHRNAYLYVPVIVGTIPLVNFPRAMGGGEVGVDTVQQK